MASPLLLGAVAAVIGCSFGKRHETERETARSGTVSDGQEWDALDLDLNSTAPMSPSRSGKGQPPPRPKTPSPNRPNCEKIALRVPQAYQTLLSRRHASLRLPENSQATRIAAITPDQCHDESIGNDVARLLLEAVSVYKPRIAVLLPLTGPAGAQGQAVYDGIKARLGGMGLRSDQVIVRDTAGKESFAEHWLAEAIFIHQVALVVGGLTGPEEALLRNYANRLYLPTLLLAPPRKDSRLSSPYVFNVFPSEMAMTDALVAKGYARGLRRVGSLVPSGRGDSDLVQSFMDAARQRNVSVVGTYSYEPGSYDSMERAAAQLFKVNRDQHSREYQEAYRKAKEKAATEGQPFDPRFVILKPSIDVDAVFIPDNFKTIRFFAKIFKYLGVDKMVLLGNQEWRAMPIIQPFEPYLEGSLFVDYIGYYNELPPLFRAFAGDSRKFLNNSNAATFDFKTIGLQTLLIAQNSLRIPAQRRYQLVNTLRLLGSTSEDIVRAPSVFDRLNRFNWPAFVFEITNKDIQLRR